MATMIAVYDQNGLIGRCDGRCHDAKHPKCKCICGAANHGVGLVKAVENTRMMVDRWVERVREHHGGEVKGRLGAVVLNECMPD